MVVVVVVVVVGWGGGVGRAFLGVDYPRSNGNISLLVMSCLKAINMGQN